jgi:hypothetical protein
MFRHYCHNKPRRYGGVCCFQKRLEISLCKAFVGRSHTECYKKNSPTSGFFKQRLIPTYADIDLALFSEKNIIEERQEGGYPFG